MSKTTGTYVGAVGRQDADIMIIGEAPGNSEALKGEPFVGRSGRLLTSLMTNAGIHRQNCYITNVVKEKPYKNNINPFIKTGKNPTITEKGRPYVEKLKEEIKKVNPNVIVAVGNTPMFVLCGETGITSRRGSIYESTLVPGKKVIPIIHPAAALRMYIYRHYISKDLGRVRRESKFPEIDIPDYDLIISPSYGESMEYLEACKQADLVAFDIEISNEEVNCISFSKAKYEAISIPFIAKGQQYFTPDQERDIWVSIAELLEKEDVKKVAHNAVFDSSFTYNRYGMHLKNIEDTMIAAAIAYPDFEKGLDFLTSIYTKMPYYKDSGKHRNPRISDHDYWIYNAKDSAVLMEILPQQLEELRSMGNLETYNAQKQLILPIVYMNARGIRMDIEKLRGKAKKAAHRMTEIREEIKRIAGRDINPNSPKQVKEYFYGDEWLGLKPYTNKGKPTTDETAMKRLVRRGFKVAEKVLEYRGLSKAKGTYYEMEFDDDDRLRCSFNPVGARTGRLSSSQTIFNTGGNMQNLTPEFKECMLPDEGYIGYEIDLGQAENRVVAYIAPDQKMIKAFEEGTDIHRLTAALIFSKPIEEVSNEPGTASIGDGSKSERFWGKTGNHSFNYDLGPRSFSLRYEIPIKDGKFIHKRYHQTYPGVKKMHSWVQDKLKNRILQNLFGRKYLFMGRWGDSLFKEAYAFIPQSTVADIINRWGLIEVYYNQNKYKPVELLSQVHDSIIFQIPKSYPMVGHVRILKDICKSMEKPLEWRGRKFSIPAEVTVFAENFKDGVEIGEITKIETKEAINELEDIIQD